MAPIRTFIEETKAATLVEFSFVAPLLFLITFGIAELGYYFYQYQTLDTATRMAVRMAATRGPIITGLPDCGVATTVAPGNFCKIVAGSRDWGPYTCTGTAPTPTGSPPPGTACDTDLMTRILQEMQLVSPGLDADNIRISYSGSGLGFVGLGRPVPVVTVEVTGVTANLPVLGAFGIGGFLMPPFTTSLTGEDLSGA